MGAFILLLSNTGIKAVKCIFALVRYSHSELMATWKDNMLKNHGYSTWIKLQSWQRPISLREIIPKFRIVSDLLTSKNQIWLPAFFQYFLRGLMANRKLRSFHHFSQTYSRRTKLPFSAESPTMILPPLLLVFSTDSAVLSPCSCFPSPWPSLKPYFCMILWATVPLQREKASVQKGFLPKTLTLHFCWVLKHLLKSHYLETENLRASTRPYNLVIPKPCEDDKCYPWITDRKADREAD